MPSVALTRGKPRLPAGETGLGATEASGSPWDRGGQGHSGCTIHSFFDWIGAGQQEEHLGPYCCSCFLFFPGGGGWGHTHGTWRFPG